MRTGKIFFICLLAGFLSLPVRMFAAERQVTVCGNDTAYAGCVLSFYTYDNYISATEKIIQECTVPPGGSFSVSFPAGVTQPVHVRLGIFNARFYAEPGHTYEVKLPPRMDKSLEEKANPFFEEVQVNLAMWSVKDHRGQTIPPERELNMQSRLFDDAFNTLYDQLAVEAARGKIKSDSAILAFRSELPVTDNRYFNNYRWYRTGLLYYASQLGGTKYVSAGFFASHPILYDNDAYMELFNTTYDRYFMYFGRTREGEKIYDVINRQASFSRLKDLLGEDEVFPSDSLLELVILKNLHDEFYADRFSRGALLRLVNSAMEQSSIEKHREIAGQIRAKITRLLPGFAPPAFSLYNQDSILVSPDTYKGKYTYLMFCTTQNYVCLSQYELLKELQRTHGQWLQIVVISVDDRFSNMRNFRNNHGYTWDFLHYANNPDIMKEYDVRIFPTCYLIDPEGKLALSPAPAANDQIERALYYELQNKRLWDEYLRKGWIVDGK